MADANMKALILEALRESVKRYPDLFEYIDGKAAWIIIRDDLQLWQAKAITQARNGEPALCEFESAVIPPSIADMVRDMLAYADCEDCIKRGFSDVEAFMKAPDSKDKHKKLPPYTGKPVKPFEFTGFTDEEIDLAFKAWDDAMPEYKGLLDAEVKRENETKFDPDQPRVPAGHSDGGQWTDGGGGGSQTPDDQRISEELAKKLIEEWDSKYGENDSPFWQDPGDGRYLVIRDENGSIVAGATVHRVRGATYIDAIASHKKDAGKVILNYLKQRNLFLTALASTPESEKWFISQGFSLRKNKPGEYNVIWVKR